ncbi:FtsX-like permease family protein [Nocardia sp. NPDC049707]|uniref:ABC transporter permease n=1 Tax=Nocardia sp. NPDC049707 TaxID=3154735 RepID=UPI0034403D7E
MPLHVAALHPIILLTATGATFAAAAFAAWAPARAAARMRPAEAMRIAPPAPRSGRSVIERLVPVLQRLPARWRMTLRAVLRNRRRAVHTIVGVAVSVSLAVTSGSVDSVLARVRQDPDVAAAEAVGRHNVELSAGNRHYDTLLVSLPSGTQMHRFTAKSGSNQLSDKGLLLESSLRDILAISVGDTVAITDETIGHRISAPVAGFVDEPLSPVAYVSADYLRRAVGAVPDTGVLVKLRPGVTDEQAVSDRLIAIPGTVAYLSTATLASAMRQAFAMYDTLVGIMLSFAAIMAAALLFNAMSANIGERLGELGALRAAGMGSGMLSRLIAAENLVLAVLGIPIGVGCGILLAHWLLHTYENQGAHLELAMRSHTPALVAAAVLVAAVVVQFPALHRVRDLDIARIVRERSL